MIYNAEITLADGTITGWLNTPNYGELSTDALIKEDGFSSLKLITTAQGLDVHSPRKDLPGISFDIYSHLRFWMLIQEPTNVDFLRITFDAPDASNQFYVNIKDLITTSNGSGEFILHKSGFRTIGNPSWAGINRIYINSRAVTGKTSTIYIDNIKMVNIKVNEENEPSKFLRIGGRSVDGMAKPLKTNLDGSLFVNSIDSFTPLRDRNTHLNLNTQRNISKSQYVDSEMMLVDGSLIGWSNTPNYGTLTADSSIKEDGTTSLKLVTTATGSNLHSPRKDLPRLSFDNYSHIRFWMNVEDTSNIDFLRIAFDAPDSSNQFYVSIKTYISDRYGKGEFTLHKNDFQKTGNPSWSAVNRIYIHSRAVTGKTSIINVQNIKMVKSKPRNGKIIIRIDDGLQSVYDVAMPILKNYGIPATCYVNPEFILPNEHGTSIAYGGTPTMSLEELKYLKTLGWCIASHSWKHNFFDDAHNKKYQQAYNDLKATQNWLTENGFADGARCHVFGNHLNNKETMQAAHDLFLVDNSAPSGYETLPWGGNSISRYSGEQKTIEELKAVVDEVAKRKCLLTLFFHRFEEVSTGNGEIIPKAMWEELISYIAKKDGIDCITMSDLVDGTIIATR